MTAIDTVNRVYREFKRYTGDGLPGEPTGAPLPGGDPSSGVHSPKKVELRTAFGEVLTAANDNAEAAEAAAEIAIGAASLFQASVFSTKALAEAYAPVMGPNYIRLEGYTTAGDGGGALYKKVVSEPAHTGKFFITLDDGVTDVWYEIAEVTQNPAMYGAPTSADAIDLIADSGCVDIVLPEGSYTLAANLTIESGINLTVKPGALIVAANTSVTLTINCAFNADRGTKVFSGFGLGKAQFDVGYANAVRRAVFPAWWGINDGTNTDQTAINQAIRSSNTIDLDGRQYNCNAGVMVSYQGTGFPYPSKTLFSSGGPATLLAAANTINLLTWADSFGFCRNIRLSSNGYTGVQSLVVGPEGGTVNVTAVNQNHNTFSDIQFLGGDAGIVMFAGLPIAGQASGCWYNQFENLYFTSVKRCIHLVDTGSVDPLHSGANSNVFINATFNGSINTAIQIDAGGGNNFYNAFFENVTTGTSPNAVPTGIIVKALMANGGANPNNAFYSAHWENCTRHAEMGAPLTKFYNSDINQALVTGAARNVFLDDGQPRASGAVLTQDAGGVSFSLNSAYDEFGWVENDGTITCSGYLQVSSVSGSPTGVVHLIGLPKPVINNIVHRAVGNCFIGNLVGGHGAASFYCRILEGTNTIDFFGLSTSGVPVSLGPYVQATTDVTFSITYKTNRF